MPRASNGTYSLPAGNPVVTGTVIASSWANNTMSDLATAMTDSLSRSGDGSMLAPLELADGLVGAPALTWGTEPTAGLYRAGAADFRFSVSSNFVAQFAAGAFRVVDGVVGTPSISFISDTDLGLYRVGANQLGVAAAQAVFPTGAVGAPSISFTGDLNTGFYNAADEIRVVTAGAEVARFVAAQFQAIAGSAATPPLTFQTDPNTGVFSGGADVWAVSTGGTQRLDITTSAISSTLPYRASAGTALIPSISFTGDVNTGFYSVADDNIGITAAGGLVAQINPSAIYHLDGSQANPSISFINDADSGWYRIGANDLALSCGNSTLIRANSSFVSLGGAQTFSSNGNAATPGYSFGTDQDVGLFLSNTNEMSVTAGNLIVAVFANNAGAGAVTIGSSGSSTITLNSATSASASAGGGAAIPATVAAFLSITINGTNRKIPFYAT